MAKGIDLKSKQTGSNNQKNRKQESWRAGSHPATGISGFTLLEIIAVLIIAAIAALVVISAVSRGKANLAGRTEALKAHIRYAQSMAMSTDEENWGIRFNADTGRYWLFVCEGGDETCDPDESDNIIPIPGTENDQDNKIYLGGEGIEFSTSEGEDATLAFDNFGTPYSGNLNQILENSLTINLSQADNSETVKVTATTGFVP